MSEIIWRTVTVYNHCRSIDYIDVNKELLKEICKKHGLKWSLGRKSCKLARTTKAQTLFIDLDRVPEEFKVKIPDPYYEKLRTFELRVAALLDDNERLRNDLKRFLDEVPHG